MEMVSKKKFNLFVRWKINFERHCFKGSFTADFWIEALYIFLEKPKFRRGQSKTRWRYSRPSIRNGGFQHTAGQSSRFSWAWPSTLPRRRRPDGRSRARSTQSSGTSRQCAGRRNGSSRNAIHCTDKMQHRTEGLVTLPYRLLCFFYANWIRRAFQQHDRLVSEKLWNEARVEAITYPGVM